MKTSRIVALALTLAMLLTALPISALAELHPHNWIEESRKEPTCTKKGSVTYSCFCGETKTESIPAAGHKWGKWKVKKEATCTREGEESRKCRVCGAKEKRKIEKLPHSYGEWTVTQEATCAAAGSRERTCQVCGHVQTGAIDPLPHSWGDWTVTVPATDFSMGTRARACGVCGAQETEDFYPDPTYRRGDRGDGVKGLQQALNDAGYDCGKADGIFGKKTEKAVAAIEEGHGVNADGIAWPGVMKWLGLVPEETDGGEPGDLNIDDLSTTLNSPSNISLKNGPVPTMGAPGEEAVMPYNLRSLVVVEQSEKESDYYDGAEIPVTLRLTIDSFDSYRLAGMSLCDGDSLNADEWADDDLLPEQSYDFTYTMVLDPNKTGWDTRKVTVRLVSLTTGKQEYESCEISTPFKPAKVTLVDPNSKPINDYMAYLYLTVHEESYIGQYHPGDAMDIPYNVSTDGNTDIRNVKLIFEEKDGYTTFSTETFDVAKKLTSHDSLDRTCHPIAYRPVPYYPDELHVEMRLTGEITNSKGKVVKIESLPVRLDYGILADDDVSLRFEMGGYLTPKKNSYSAGDKVQIHINANNRTDVALNDVLMEYAWPYEDMEAVMGPIGDAAACETLGINQLQTAVIEYTVKLADVEKGSIDVAFVATGKRADDGREIRTQRQEFSIPINDGLEENLKLQAGVINPLESYPRGMEVPCTVMLHNTDGHEITHARLYTVGDNDSPKSYFNDNYHDFGHGVKGYQYALESNIKGAEWREYEAYVTIPEDFEGKVFRAAWIAEADLKDSAKSVQSNVATIYLPVGEAPEETLEMNVGIHDPRDQLHVPGEPATISIGAVYTGATPPDAITFRYRLQGSDEWLGTFSADMYKGFRAGTQYDLQLDADDLVDGAWTFEFQAFATERPDLAAEPMLVQLQAAESEEPVEGASEQELTLYAERLNEGEGPNGEWSHGETVKVKVYASYIGATTPYRISVSAVNAGNTEVPVAEKQVENAAELDDVIEFTMDSTYKENDTCVYVFEAQASVNNPDVFDCWAEPYTLEFKMAPSAGGPDDMSGGDGGHGSPDTQINWDAIHAAEAAGLGLDGTDSGDSKGGATADGGTAADGGTPADGGAAADGGTTADGGATADGGTTAEGGTPADGSAAADGGTPADGGTTTDGGTATDGGATADGGTAADGGTTADGGAAAEGSTTAEGGTVADGGTTVDGSATTDGGTAADGGTPADGGDSTGGWEETVVTIPGEGHDIPATVCMPKGEGPFPAVVMLHGTGSTRDEAGDGYKYAAPVLAEEYGIATIRIDFPGNGDSTADYMQYDFRSAVADAKAAADYMAGLECIDGNAIGVMGWSQGGTDALLACAWEPETFKSIVTWAGAPDMMLDGFFSQEDYDEAKANGFFVMEFDWRDSLNVSLQWCDDVANTDVLAEFASGYSGPVLAIAGTDDDTVDPVWSEKIVAASGNEKSRTYFIEGMDHTFNVFAEEDLHSLYDAVDATGAFFAETLG